jgi:hypothetical protein
VALVARGLDPPLVVLPRPRRRTVAPRARAAVLPVRRPPSLAAILLQVGIRVVRGAGATTQDPGSEPPHPRSPAMYPGMVDIEDGAGRHRAMTWAWVRARKVEASSGVCQSEESGV